MTDIVGLSETPSGTRPPGPDADDDAVADATEEAGSTQRRRWQQPAVLVLGLVVACGIPLAVALGVLAEPRWYPASDFAQTELRLRDITEGQPPLVGLAGRIYGLGLQGSHPGPISFYALFPFYRAAGSQPWGLLAGAVALNLTAMGTAIAIAYRRGGRIGALGLAAALTVLVRAYGEDKLVEPWNPYLPVLWWVVLLLAVWSVLVDDLVFLPVAAFAGTFCAQTHVSYVGLVAGLAGLTVAALAIAAWQRRGQRAALRRMALRVLPSGVLLGVLWIPPLVEQVRGDPGNLAILRDWFAHPELAPLGLGRDALELWLAHLDVGVLLGHTRQSMTGAPTGPVAPGLVLLGLWLAAVVVAVRARREVPALWRLHLVVGVAAVLELVSMSRVHGIFFDYLSLWAWGTTMLMVAATVWSATVALRRSRSEVPRRLAPPAVASLALVLVAGSASATYDAAHAELPGRGAARISQQLSPQVVEALEAPDALGGSTDGPYLLRWDAGALALDQSAYGLLIELTRAGFDVGIEARVAVPARAHRVLDPEDATAAINYALGPRIEDWRATPGAVEAGYFDPRSDDDIEQSELDAPVAVFVAPIDVQPST